MSYSLYEILSAGIHRQNWARRAYAILSALASGLSTQMDIVLFLQMPNGGDTNLIFRQLETEGWIERSLGRIGGGGGFYILRLTSKARGFCINSGMYFNPSDLDLLEQKHQGYYQRKHTASVLYFAYQARRREWDVQVMPPVKGKMIPDLRVSRPGEWLYVEVETRFRTGRSKARKWDGLYKEYGEVNVVVKTEAQSELLMNWLQDRYYPGRITELEWLAKEDLGLLWHYRFSDRNESLMRDDWEDIEF